MYSAKKIHSKGLLLILLVLISVHARAQVIWSEPFNYSDGTVTGGNNNTLNPSPDWTSACPTCLSGDWFEVRSNRMEARDTNGPASMETESIDISNLPGGARVRITLSESGNMEPCPGTGSGYNSVDWVRIEYKLDNNAWTDVGSPAGGPCSVQWANGLFYTLGDFTSAQVDICPLEGDSLRLRISTQTWAADEYIRIDDIEVSQQTCLPVAARDSLVMVSCNGLNDGEIWIQAFGTPPPFSYSLNGGPFQTTGSFTNLSPGTYSVTVRNGANQQTTLQNLVITEPPALFFSDSIVRITCEGGVDGEIWGINPGGGTPPYSWQLNSGPLQSGPGFTGLTAGSYQLTLVDDAGCDTTVSLFLADPPLLTTSVAAYPTSCGVPDGAAAVTASGGIPPYSYQWSTPAPVSTDSLSGLAAGTYYVTVTDSLGCTRTDTAIILNPGAPTVVLSLADTLCEGDSLQLLPLVSGGAPPYAFAWSCNTATCPLDSASDDDPWVFPSQNTDFYLVVTDAVGCSASPDTVSIQVEQQITHQRPQDLLFCPGEPIQIGTDPVPGLEYLWSPYEGLQTVNTSRTNVLLFASGNYVLRVTDPAKVTPNCRSRDFEVVLTADDCLMPNVLTPNGDGVNDRLILGNFFNDIDLFVYDRWGVEVYREEGYKNEWFGTNMSGLPVPEGVYYYVVKAHWTGLANTPANGRMYEQAHSLTIMR